jgi:hypothetical protein
MCAVLVLVLEAKLCAGADTVPPHTVSTTANATRSRGARNEAHLQGAIYRFKGAYAWIHRVGVAAGGRARWLGLPVSSKHADKTHGMPTRRITTSRKSALTHTSASHMYNHTEQIHGQRRTTSAKW